MRWIPDAIERVLGYTVALIGILLSGGMLVASVVAIHLGLYPLLATLAAIVSFFGVLLITLLLIAKVQTNF